MNSAKRLAHISRQLEIHGAVNIAELAEQLNVTPKTIRLDLRKMEEMELVERVHGGAILPQDSNGVFRIKSRRQTNLREKEAIAELALKYIESNDILILDGGSTPQIMAQRLDNIPITLLTNDLFVAGEVLNKHNITLYLTGGRLSDHRQEGVYTLFGRDAEAVLGKYQVNKLFLGVTALHFEQGLMVYSEDVAETKKDMIRAADQVICLLDYSKFHRQAFLPFAGLDEIDVIITDDRISQEDREFLTQKGIKVEVAQTNRKLDKSS